MSTKRTTHSCHNDNKDYQIGDYIKLRQKEGFIRYIGKRKHNHGIWFGIELVKGIGSNDGSEHGERYFCCQIGKGIFVRHYSIKKKMYPPPIDPRKKYIQQKQTISERTHKMYFYNNTKTSENDTTHSHSHSINSHTSFENILSNKTIHKSRPNRNKRHTKKRENISSKHKRLDSKSGGSTRIEKKQNIAKRFEQQIKQNSIQTIDNLHISQTPTFVDENTIRDALHNYYPEHGMHLEIKTKQSLKTDDDFMEHMSKTDCNSSIKPTRHKVTNSIDSLSALSTDKKGKSYSRSSSNNCKEYDISSMPDIPEIDIIAIDGVQLDDNENKNKDLPFGYNLNGIQEEDNMDSNGNNLQFGYNLSEIHEDEMDKNINAILCPLEDITSEDLNHQIEIEYRHSRTFSGLNLVDMSSISSCESVDIKELELDKNEQISNLRNRFSSVNSVINNMLHTMITNDNINDFKIDIKSIGTNNLHDLYTPKNNENESDKSLPITPLPKNNSTENDNEFENNNNNNNNELLTLHYMSTETSAKSESVSLSFNRQINNTSEIDHEITTRIKLRSSESEQSTRSESKRNNEDLIRNVLANIDIEMNININAKQSVTINEDYNEDCNIWSIVDELDKVDDNYNEMKTPKKKQKKIKVNKNDESFVFNKLFNNRVPFGLVANTPPEVIHHYIPRAYEQANLNYRIKSQKERNKKYKIDESDEACVGLWDRIIAKITK